MKGLWDGGGLLGFSVVQVEMLTPSLQQTKQKGGGESWLHSESRVASVERPQPDLIDIIGSQVPRCSLQPDDSGSVCL